MSVNKKERLVAAIKNGTVIDHIPADKTFQVVALLELQTINEPITIGNNYASKMMGKKGIIKVTDRYFTNEEISRLSVVAPNVVLNIIKDYEVIKRWKHPKNLRVLYAATTQSASPTTSQCKRFSTWLTKKTAH